MSFLRVNVSWSRFRNLGVQAELISLNAYYECSATNNLQKYERFLESEQ